MARNQAKTDAGSNRFDDVVGLVLGFAAVLLMLALLSYDPKDLARDSTEVNAVQKNLIGTFGAYLAYALFRVIGAAAYLIPPLLLGFGLARFLEPLGYLKGKWPWAIAFVVASMGMLHLYYPLFDTLKVNLNLVSPGGLCGMFACDYFLSYLGRLGATLILIAVYLISFLYLTNFHLREWLREWWAERSLAKEQAAETEAELERRARDLEKQARKLKEQVEEVEKTGLGADLQPVPEPTVRDLSVPQPRPAEASGKSGRSRSKTEPQPAPEPPIEEVEVIPAREIIAATTADILGRPAEPKIAEAKVEAPPVTEPGPPENPFTVPATPEAAPAVETAAPAGEAPPAPVKPKPAPRKPKPITVAATPKIGNYRLPTLDFLQHPDSTLKPTESKEELMANARLMQNTLAQFGIEVSLGDITKGPTITRYELHPAPGVKLEKITALNNNIAAALKAERIHILAPVPGKSSVGVEVPNLVKTKVIMRDLLESEEWQKSKARIPLALCKDVYGHPIMADLAEMPHLLIAGSTGSGKSVCINAIIASLLYRFPPDQLRFVMI
ncbi:MAG: DNA translocase FtsK, partial [Pedosphaera parvula]|nr:DNA translocase FtsK [Pedosphaera parvula]